VGRNTHHKTIKTMKKVKIQMPEVVLSIEEVDGLCLNDGMLFLSTPELHKELYRTLVEENLPVRSNLLIDGEYSLYFPTRCKKRYSFRQGDGEIFVTSDDVVITVVTE
jgi:hypothetical protein